jgi:hypothetical protein
MSNKKTRSDKKFNVKLWTTTQDKKLFRKHCTDYHLSMMFVAEKYMKTCLDEFPDTKLDEIISIYLGKFRVLNKSNEKYEPIGVRLTNNYWQKIAHFAILHDSTVSKVSSCLFEYCLNAYELQGIEEQHGLTFAYNRKKRFEGRSFEDGRLSDY